MRCQAAMSQLEDHGQGGGRALPEPKVTLVCSRTVAKVDSIGFLVRKGIQCSADFGRTFATLAIL